LFLTAIDKHTCASVLNTAMKYFTTAAISPCCIRCRNSSTSLAEECFTTRSADRHVCTHIFYRAAWNADAV